LGWVPLNGVTLPVFLLTSVCADEKIRKVHACGGKWSPGLFARKSELGRTYARKNTEVESRWPVFLSLGAAI
jgi:hypothetical protein